MLVKSIFREYDIRGLVDIEIDDDFVSQLGKAYAAYVTEKGAKSISVGGDVRPSSENYKEILVKEFLNAGLDVFDLGITATPVSYYSPYAYGVEAELMVTASHNPSEYNGFKMGFGKGSVFGEEIQKIYQMVSDQTEVKGKGKGQYNKVDANKDYAAKLKESFPNLKPVKMVVDGGNATAGLIVPELYEEVGIDVTSLYMEIDGSFPNHHPDPSVEENLKDLSKKVVEIGADVGAGFDGDSDRIGAIDEKGNFIYGDYLLLLYASHYLAEKKSGTIVYEVKCSKALKEVINEKGGTPIMWKTGHSNLKAKMHEVKATMAGEVSGHMFFADRYYGYDDAIYAGLRLAEVVGSSKLPLSELMDQFPKYHITPEIRLECPDDAAKFNIAKKAREYFSSKYPVVDIDGVRVEFEEGWGLIRASNTQPVLSMRFEAEDEAALDKIKTQTINKLKEFGEFKI